MPTITSVEPVAPGVKRTPSECVAYGRQQWTRKWKVFASQWSQPQLMKLAAAVLGESALHSSQIHGFTSGKLRDPAPKVLLAIGQLNKAIAYANGADVEMSESDGRCPETMADLWRDRTWMTDPRGIPLDEVGVFQAITGLIDLATDQQSLDLTKETMPAVSKSLGRYLRKSLMNQGVDFMDEDLDPILEKLVYGKPLTQAQFEKNLEFIAETCEVETDQLIDEAVLPALN